MIYRRLSFFSYLCAVIDKMEIRFDKIPNARDLGGIRTTDGHTVRSGLLLRTAFLVNASSEDLRRLSEEFHVAKVIDLRSKYEVGKMPDAEVAGAQHAHVEIVTLNGHLFKGMHAFAESSSSFEEGMARFIMTPAAKMICDGFYISFVEDPECQDSLHEFFSEVLSTDGPVLWHCTQGKDRTGLCAALLLYALGVSREEVMKDFLITNESYARDIEEVNGYVRNLGGGEEETTCVWTLVGVNRQQFEAALDVIDSRFGGPEGFLKNQLRLSAEDITELRRRYLL